MLSWFAFACIVLLLSLGLAWNFVETWDYYVVDFSVLDLLGLVFSIVVFVG